MPNAVAALRALHPFPSLVVALTVTALVPLSDANAPLERYVTLGLGMLLFQFAIGLVNDIVDVDDDRAVKPWKPLARGVVSPGTATVAAVALAGAGLLLTLRLPTDAWLIGALGLSLGLAYDLYLKRTLLSWLPFALAFPLVPIWVYLASDAWRPLLWWTLPLGGLLGLGLHLANQAPDAADESTGLPGRLGEQRSRVLAVLVFAAVALAVGIILSRESRGLAAGALGVGSLIVAMSPWATVFGRDGLFGAHALGAAALAVLFLAAV